MNILLFSGCFDTAIVSLFDGERLLGSKRLPSRSTSLLLAPAVGDLLKSFDVDFRFLDLIAVEAGPGAFTSLRVLVVTANAIAHAISKPVYSFNGLETRCFSQSLKSSKRYVVTLLNAYSNQVFVSVFDRLKNIFLHENLCIFFPEALELLLSFSSDADFLVKIKPEHQAELSAKLTGFDPIDTTVIDEQFVINKILDCRQKSCLKTSEMAMPFYIKAGFVTK